MKKEIPTMTDEQADKLAAEMIELEKEKDVSDTANSELLRIGAVSMVERNLFQRLLAIMEEAGSVKKGGFNEFDKYSYITESDIAKKMQKLFVAHGVMVLSSVDASTTEACMTSAGKPSMLSKVRMVYTFVNVDEPDDQFKVFAVGDGMDRGDKAIYKALTGAHKYFLIRNFNLGSDEDAEKESPAVGNTGHQGSPSTTKGLGMFGEF